MRKFTGPELKVLRRKAKLSQTDFWSPLGVTQSAACRYEQGRAIPRTVQCILSLLVESSTNYLFGLRGRYVKIMKGTYGKAPLPDQPADVSNQQADVSNQPAE